MTEAEIQQIIQMEAAKYGCALLRNNSGALKDSEGRLVRFGLGNNSKHTNDNFKSSDLIGPKVVIITPEMVGQKIAVMTAIECKEPGWVFNPNNKREVAQHNFNEWIKSYGGFAGFAQSIEDMKRIIGV